MSLRIIVISTISPSITTLDSNTQQNSYSKMTLSKVSLSITKLSIMPFTKMTSSIITLSMHNNKKVQCVQHKCYAECHNVVIMLTVVLLSVVMLSVVMLSVVAPLHEYNNLKLIFIKTFFVAKKKKKKNLVILLTDWSHSFFTLKNSLARGMYHKPFYSCN